MRTDANLAAPARAASAPATDARGPAFTGPTPPSETTYRHLYEAIVASGSDTPLSYGSPRAVRFGAELRF